MKGNWHADDFRAVTNLLGESEWNLNARLTMCEQVAAFEEEFARWQGCKHAVMVNSGASANLVTMAAVQHRRGHLLVAVPALTWASDISSVLWVGMEPQFHDVDRRTLGIKSSEEEPINADVVFLTHCMGFNALPVTKNRGAILIEDCCESIGARNQDGSKVGTKGLAANFSFYYAHHMTTVEGGMVTTDDADFARTCRMLRDHGLRQENRSEFVFELPGFNVRPTEIAAVIGRSQLKRLDENLAARKVNLAVFLDALDEEPYQTDYPFANSSPYGLVLVLRKPSAERKAFVESHLIRSGVEFRRGVAGGGNQLRQPYLKRLYGDTAKCYPNAEHLTDYGWTIGNWPGLPHQWIADLCKELNAL